MHELSGALYVIFLLSAAISAAGLAVSDVAGKYETAKVSKSPVYMERHVPYACKAASCLPEDKEDKGHLVYCPLNGIGPTVP